jgi:ubiquinone/menaquinone biosynthesis C-methylase UbiE
MYRTDLEFTGERVVPGKTPDEIYREHTDRYQFAAGLTGGMTVLDVACGTGYGTKYLVERGAGRIAGADFSLESVRYASERFGCETACFVCADGVRLPFAGGCFDAVVSFETVEHIQQYETFLAECRRVLRDGGLVVCSTPNRRIFSPELDKPLNWFHVREFWPEEFRELLGRYFVDITLYGQCDVDLRDNSVERDRGIHEFRDDEQISSGYLIAVARKEA